MMTAATKTRRLRAFRANRWPPSIADGYLRFTKPVFPPEKFAALRDHFEQKLLACRRTCARGMDVPHFTDLRLFDWLFADEVLDLVEPILGPDIALFSSHFICKPKGNGKRVPGTRIRSTGRG
jgi:hypothetical protein